MATLRSHNLIIVKIGSALLVDEQTGKLNTAWLHALAKDICAQIENGTQIAIVSSGAIALGRTHLGLKSHSLTLAQKQACAAVGQVILTHAYAEAFRQDDLITAQALLTLNDTEDRRRYINAKATLETLLSQGAIPIINENDTVATDEIRYGDNDRLAARVAQMIGADLLLLLSDIDGLYDKDPNSHKSARHIPIVDVITDEILAMGGEANP
ncbi:MAG TPA: glutamate 5-kinase, partial [Hellea balneolensis]|nr:glutamate 5-kinase [Hellea balneolensis]